MTILVIEDDRKLARLIIRGLKEEGHAIVHCDTGEEGAARLEGERFDACVLDVLLPGVDGFEVLEHVRAHGVTTPILMLTARDGVDDRVRGLNLGADDYLVKPFAFAELLARLGALLRRGVAQRGTLLAHDGLTLEATTRQVRVDEHEVTLSAKQFALLEFLLRRRGEVVARTALLEHVFGYKFDPGTNVVDVHVANLRQIIDRAQGPSRIETIRGIGYRLGRPDAA